MATLGINADGRAAIPPVSLAAIGSIWSRCVAYPDADIRTWIHGCHDRGLRVLLVLAHESIGGDANYWAERIARYRNLYYGLIDAWQLGNEPDHVSPSSWTMSKNELSQLLRTGRNVLGDSAYIVGAGLVSGQTSWAAGVDWSPVQALACLVPDQRVTARNPTLAMMRQYIGDVVTIQTASGNQVTCTPNHPILTRQGWLPASKVHEGTEIAQYKRRERAESGRANDVDVPTRVADVFRSLNSSRAIRPGLPLDFHGDGRYTDVHIVRSNRLLRDALPQPIEQFSFPLSATIPSEFSGRSENRLQARSFAGALEAQALSVGSSSRRQMMTFEQRMQPAIPNTDLLGKSDNRLSRHMALMQGENIFISPTPRPAPGPNQQVAALELPRQVGSRVPDGGREFLECFAGQVAFVEVSHVGIGQFRGHVYNLTTEDGLITADDIITHNCHPYAKEPGTPELDSLIEGYAAYGRALWVTEYHARTIGMAAALRDDPRLTTALAFCYTDRMVPGFGLIEDYRALNDYRTATAGQMPNQPPTDQPPEYVLGFEKWHDLEPDLLGNPLANERNVAPGWQIQPTSRGVLSWVENKGHAFITHDGRIYRWQEDWPESREIT